MSTNKCNIDGQLEIATWQPKPEVLIPYTWNYDRQDRNSNSKSGVFELDKTVPGNDRQPEMGFLGANRHFGLTVVVAITWLHYYRARHCRKFLICLWNFIVVTVPEI